MKNVIFITTHRERTDKRFTSSKAKDEMLALTVLGAAKAYFGERK